MKHRILLILMSFISILLVSSLVYSGNKKDNPANTIIKEENNVKKIQSVIPKEELRKTKHAFEFIPSEKIEADTSVPFPVDI